MQIKLSGPDIIQSDIDAVAAVMRSGSLSLGPAVPQFEAALAQYVGRKHAVAVNSGTSALHLCLLGLGIGPGDEVITTPFSFIATTNCILMVGAKPVFADIDPDTYNIDVERISERITPNTRAVLPVEVFGNPAGIDRAEQLARQHDLLCIEDSCEALGSTVNGRKVGSLGAASTFAFYPNKQMTTGEGGMLVTDDADLAALCASLRNQGRDSGAGWLAHQRLGYNYRLSDINCVLGAEQLKRIELFVEKRSQVAGWYQQMLADEPRLIVPTETPNCRTSWFVFVVRLADQFTPENRNEVLQLLNQRGIGCSNYFTPIHLQPYITQLLNTKPGDFPVTERIAERTVALPFCNNITEQQVQTVCTNLKEVLDTLA